MLLGFILEEIYQNGLKNIFETEVALTLKIKTTFCPREGPIAPTEDGYRRTGPLDRGLSIIMGPVPIGRVHDDNSAFLGGQAGHAGLFSSAGDVWKILEALADCFEPKRNNYLVSLKTLKEFLKPQPAKQGPLRAMGFDIRTEGVLKGAVGHLGYTGGSVWWDREKDLAYVFLNNRVHPTAGNSLITEFRPRLENEIFLYK
jgi:CubicO group peptidase (beta-lactamase class C family)